MGSVVKAITGQKKEKPRPAPTPAPAPVKIMGRDAAAEAAAAKRRAAKYRGGGLMATASLGSGDSSGGLPMLGAADLTSDRTLKG